jgi:hypothetical protein
MNPVQVGLHEGPGEKCGLVDRIVAIYEDDLRMISRIK